MSCTPEEVLRAWFDTDDASAIHTPLMDRWFKADPALDEMLRARFADDIAAAARGERAAWEGTPRDTLALIVLMDQFSRNIYRGDARTYAADEAARGVASRAIERGDDRRISWLARSFVYLPFEHAESMPEQDRSVALFRALATEAPEGFEKLGASFVDYAEKHRAVIARFGRFPHRNADLSRESTDEEREFLKSGRGF